MWVPQGDKFAMCITFPNKAHHHRCDSKGWLNSKAGTRFAYGTHNFDFAIAAHWSAHIECMHSEGSCCSTDKRERERERERKRERERAKLAHQGDLYLVIVYPPATSNSVHIRGWHAIWGLEAFLH